MNDVKAMCFRSSSGVHYAAAFFHGQWWVARQPAGVPDEEIGRHLRPLPTLRDDDGLKWPKPATPVGKPADVDLYRSAIRWNYVAFFDDCLSLVEPAMGWLRDIPSDLLAE